MAEKIIVFCENDRLARYCKVTFELLSVARSLAENRGFSVIAVSFKGHSEGSDALFASGADEVIEPHWTEKEGLFNLETVTHIASEVIRKLDPVIVLFGATDLGRVLAPKVAANVRCGITADCTGFEINKDGKLVQIRPALGGNILAHIISPERLPQMATVRPGVFKVKEFFNHERPIEKMFFEIPNTRRHVIENSRVSNMSAECEKIEDAKIIVAVGHGVRSKELLKKIEDFAKSIGGVCACSRKIVESGWMEHSRQVGQSGKTISPDIYIAIGISGAVQHLAGMKTSMKIIAVNTDANAEIFSVAHTGFVMDASIWLEKATEFFTKKV
ncbi:MAG TPA: electron transfer flavoprotein subunit alpha/FixB family protein [bacterium]|jgi:electron transfer flavoprotein alpha subunit|nr:electron transfer flavoprotein subunit alpha/FixB family protein [bacterium]MDX9804295.1 electron transfer flavoprotein subunit alpha/FixB family protein [bacterium]HOG42633.1 electron transfer flavoprotein subunit alpha/FixB family protein [bacterium]HPM45464.1 electron transfer flavoprotein subunit alpha/FixB family protein [bacterium]HPV21772.1 electron transfer flavoprotein subunit alpha/FixB family protein [bacterium]